MPKHSKIKWRDSDQREIERVVRNFNAKVARVAKKNPEIAQFLPEKASIRELKSKITTRQDFNRELNKLQRFSRKGSENVKTLAGGKTLTHYEHKEAQITARAFNAKQARKRKESGFSVQKGTMGQLKNQNLLPRKLSDTKKASDWDRMVKTMENALRSNYDTEKMEAYRKNYLGAIEKELLGTSIGKELLDFLKTLDTEFLVNNSLENPLLSIDFPYDPIETQLKAEAILEEWRSL